MISRQILRCIWNVLFTAIPSTGRLYGPHIPSSGLSVLGVLDIDQRALYSCRENCYNHIIYWRNSYCSPNLILFVFGRRTASIRRRRHGARHERHHTHQVSIRCIRLRQCHSRAAPTSSCDSDARRLWHCGRFHHHSLDRQARASVNLGKLLRRMVHHRQLCYAIHTAWSRIPSSSRCQRMGLLDLSRGLWICYGMIDLLASQVSLLLQQ
jgi:hypothetical protein